MKARIRFRKSGPICYIGHLDMMRYFQKAVRRAEIPAAYTEGMSPHMEISFAAPLGVGIASDGEYFDIGLSSEIDPEKAMERLNAVMTEGVEVVSFCPLPDKEKNCMSVVSGADYTVSFCEGKEPCTDWTDKWTSFVSQSAIRILKKTKTDQKVVDIRPMIYLWSLPRLSPVNGKEGDHSIYLRVAQGSSNNLKPELVMEAFYLFLKKQYSSHDFSICRNDILKWQIHEGRQVFKSLDGSEEL